MDLSEIRPSTQIRHPWETARAAAIATLVTTEITNHRPHQPLRWLDVGAGDAWLAAEIHGILPAGSTMTCWDTEYTADHLDTFGELYDTVSLTASPPDGRVDVISLLDVLEHIENDRDALADIVDQYLVPGGYLIITVPAYNRLFTRHDTALGHHRRYHRASLHSVLPDNLTVIRDGGLFMSLLPARAAAVAAERLTRTIRRRATISSASEAGIGGWSRGPLTTRAIATVLGWDARASRAVSRAGRFLPGLSIWLVAQREPSPDR